MRRQIKSRPRAGGWSVIAAALVTMNDPVLMAAPGTGRCGWWR